MMDDGGRSMLPPLFFGERLLKLLPRNELLYVLKEFFAASFTFF